MVWKIYDYYTCTHEPIKKIVLEFMEISLNKCGIVIGVDQLQSNIVTSLAVVTVVMLVEILVIKIFCWIKSCFPESIQKDWIGWIYN